MQLNDPALQQFLDDEVRAGRFASVEAAIEAAVGRMKLEAEIGEPLDEETLDAIDEAEAQYARGEYFTIDQVRAKFASLKSKGLPS